MTTLHPDHKRDLERSGLSDQTITDAGIRSLSPHEISRKNGFFPPGIMSGYEFPYSEEVSRFKVFYEEGAEVYANGKKKPKYLQPKDTSNKLYIPPKIKNQLNDESIPLYITEGEKKTLKANQEGLLCAGVAGLWSWKKKGKEELIEDFDQITLKGRRINIVPDNDYLKPNMHGYSKNLGDAVHRLAAQLIRRGAKVFIVELPPGPLKGLDDYLCTHSVEDFKKLPHKAVRKGQINKTKREKLNAKSILQQINLEDFLYVPDVGFYHYNQDGYWEEIGKPYIEKSIKEIIDEPSRYKIAETLKMFELEILISLGKELNFDKWILNLKSGLMDIKTGEVKPHRRNFLSTIQLPVSFDPKAKCPIWKKFLKDVVEADELIRILQEFIGLCLIPETKFEKCLVLVGAGANGKSTFLNIVQYLLGKANISTVPMGKLSSEFYRAYLLNKLVNISSELEISELVSSGYFKSIVSGDTIDAAFKFKDIFSFKPFARLIFAMNELPRCKDRSFGYYRRFLIVPFDKQFTGKNADRMLSKKLLDEIDGIFIWAMAGLKRLFEQDGFTESKVINDVISQYRQDNNPVITFVEECCNVDPDATLGKKELYEAYRAFCEDNGNRPLHYNQFLKELKKQIPAVHDVHMRNEDGSRERILYGLSIVKTP